MCDDCLFDTVANKDKVEEFKRRVDAGVAMMDERYPGWLNDINLSTFDLEDAHTCVLGQTALARGSVYTRELYQISYGYAPVQLANHVMLNVGQSERDLYTTQAKYGFSPDGLVSWNQSTQIWRDKIVALKMSRNPVPNPAILV